MQLCPKRDSCLSVRAYFNDLLRAVSAPNALFEFCFVFIPKTLNMHNAQGGLHSQIALNVLKYAYFYSYRTHALPF